MSEKSMEALISGLTIPPEVDNNQEDQDNRLLLAIYESSTIDILSSMNKDSFKDTYNILKNDILSMPDVYQKIFLDKYLDEMVKIYEYEFSPTPIYDKKETINDMFKFIEFVEYDNLTFLKYMWKYLDDILTVDIDKYVQENADTIVNEITNQADLLFTLTENTSEFLRTYNKESILEWFSDRSKRNKFNIFAENLE